MPTASNQTKMISAESVYKSTLLGLWFCSVFTSGVAFTVLICSLLYGFGEVLPVFRLTMLFALPVACLWAPFVLMLKKPEQQTTLLITTTLIGPGSDGGKEPDSSTKRRGFAYGLVW